MSEFGPSEKDDFEISLMYFCSFVIISHFKWSRFILAAPIQLFKTGELHICN